MTSLVAKYVSRKILKESAHNNFGQEDPYFETVPATRLNGTPTGKMKKRRKALPPGISEHDGKVLTKVKRRAYRLDMSLFNCCGIRFGWSSVIGIIPAIGDVLDAFMALMVLRTCEQIEGGLPANIKMKMYINIVVDFGIGLVPFLGDMADALFRANTKNAVILEKYLREKGAKALKAQGQSAQHITDPSDPDEFDQHVLEDNPPPQYTTAPSSRHESHNAQPGDRRGRYGNSNIEPDVERGERVPLSQMPRTNQSAPKKNRR
ncbi:PH domain-containing protein [Xylogone sp. PMI_703]|nr:PH domain-containing protein [Xylogone sp. PMI_703]